MRKTRRNAQREVICQPDLFTSRRGGARPGAGRKPKGDHAGVSHSARCAVASRHPIHITTRLLSGIPSLRRGASYRAVRRALSEGCLKPGFRVVEWAVMSNHIHLLCEADSRVALTHGLQGLLIRIAKALNRTLGRTGSVFRDRYHDRVLKTPREVRNAIAYVLNDARRHAAEHGRSMPRGWIDPCSSGPSFGGWIGQPGSPEPGGSRAESTMPRATTWLLAVGWQRAGPIRIDDVPGGMRRLRHVAPSRGASSIRAASSEHQR